MLTGLHHRFFALIHGNRLIYNTCWEDPLIDRQLLNLEPDSEVVVITSAGCNVLDYLLDGPGSIHAVDMNFLSCWTIRIGWPGTTCRRS